ncbi:MAG TPA: D-alanine--D-alanine ligase [Bacteroidia bacterium]|nr:D-alanine--D-alanine ligase [Bacteroidia bacterium]
MNKLKIGILFGGTSREREVSFAGGRTVYDNLDKTLFEPIPLFVDSFGNLLILDWQFIYKGSIRDFYPPAEFLPETTRGFQIYAENLGTLTHQEQIRLTMKLGTRIEFAQLPDVIDFAFLCLHGSDGEDGRIQGLLEYYRIPYSGSGILSSAIGMNKVIQKDLMKKSGFNVPEVAMINRSEWVASSNRKSFIKDLKSVGFPCVVKAANQGSSIGISVLKNNDADAFIQAVNKSFFIREITRTEWNSMTFDAKTEWIKKVSDIREGIGLPAKINDRIIYHPEELLGVLIQLFGEMEDVVSIAAIEAETEVIIESFISGKEFSCIVIANEKGKPVALPPTEIRKGNELFDYRAKYLPGLSRKVTPIHLPEVQIETIRRECERLFISLNFSVYARIDGFITENGSIFLNDPNTTSGMMPSSFFFHQAAEIGLNPSQFISYIISTSLQARLSEMKSFRTVPQLIKNLHGLISKKAKSQSEKIKVGVIMGGYSSERHISVESGRNVYEKLSSTEKYEPIPYFLAGNEQSYSLYRIPINLMLKDNADDIREKILNYNQHPVIKKIIDQCGQVTQTFANAANLNPPEKISFEELAQQVKIVFIALHGRPGEDGELQLQLNKVGLPFNGSRAESSKITIDKFQTNELLAQNGFKVAHHYKLTEEEWRNNPSAIEEKIQKEFGFPIIAKPVDDGCSSAVKIIRNENQLHAYAELIFREDETLNTAAAELLKIKDKEEFPRKRYFLIETLISGENCKHFLEITGGMLTTYDETGNIHYEIFEPSETLHEGDVLSLEEKFLAGEGQNITPARYSKHAMENRLISDIIRKELMRAARLLNIEGYARIDAFVRITNDNKVEVIFIEVNSLPGMTPATCIFHQAAINQYKPYEFIEKILEFGFKRNQLSLTK